MTISGFLPQRWRATPEAARHAEAIAGILHSAPIESTADGVTIVSLLGTAQVLPYLVAVKSLRSRLGRGRIAILDDGTLTGEDRAILAHHCGDPEILPHQAVARGPFPADSDWALLLTILDRRAGQYLIALDPHSVTLTELPDAEAAIASNRSFALVGDAPPGGRARRLERRLAALCGTRGWRYRAGCGGLVGFAAGGGGRVLATSLHGELSALGEALPAELTGNAILANEAGSVLLPRDRYARHRLDEPVPDAAFVHFPGGPGHGEPFADASRTAISALLS